jgi:pimeloyl-ACP methyl ester carboxylesterase
MKRYTSLLVALLLMACCARVAAQSTTDPFTVKQSGKGKQAIVFIPGFASSDAVWDETKARYEKDFTCYSVTMAGFAGVAPQPDPTFEKWVSSIAGYIKMNKIQKPVIIGHSMGGVMALALAAAYPDLPAKIVVVDALPCLSALMNPAFQAKENNDCAPMVNQFTALPDEQFKQMQNASITQLLADKSKHDMVVDWSLKTDRKTFAQMFCDFSNTDMREKIKNITCPSLILLESYFVHTKPAIEAQYKNLKSANLQYASKGLHFIMYDDQEWYFTQLDKYLTNK